MDQKSKKQHYKKKAHDSFRPKNKGTGVKVPTNLIWGMHAAKEAWLNPRRVVKRATISPKALELFQETLEIAKQKKLKRPEFDIVDPKEFDARLKLNRDTVHQFIALEVEDLPEVFLDEHLARIERDNAACILVLDQVTDPHNIGAILRSASAFGIGAVIMQTRHAPQNFNGVLAKTACGGLEHIEIIKETNLSRAIETCKERGFIAYALDERGAITLGERATDIKARSLFVMGAEGKGVRPSLLESCHHSIKLNTKAPIQSLNVSNAAAITLYEYDRAIKENNNEKAAP